MSAVEALLEYLSGCSIRVDELHFQPHPAFKAYRKTSFQCSSYIIASSVLPAFMFPLVTVVMQQHLAFPGHLALPTVLTAHK